MAQQEEKFSVRLFDDGKIRNRTEAHLVAYAQELLAAPVAMTIEQVWQDLEDELALYMYRNPSHGFCRISEPRVNSRISGKPHLVTRSIGVYGRGRALSTLVISESIRKDALNGYAPAEGLIAA